jgi:aryl-alcohol dehydrogenase-like predicted oxidoreductase
VEYSLINRKIERNGLLKLCQEQGITCIAYSPLGRGVLTGKYSSKNPPAGIRGRRYSAKFLDKIEPLIRLLHEIGREHGGKTPGQVALNWIIKKGAVPIPGAKNRQQALENAGALGWKLSDSELIALDQASNRLN